MKNFILLLCLPLLCFCCDDRFISIPPKTCEVPQVKIMSAPNLKIDGEVWDDDLAPDYCFVISDLNRVAVSDTSEVISCNPMLLPLLLKNNNSHLKTNQYYKLIILDKDGSGQSEVMASLEFSPFDLYKNDKSNYHLSNQYLDVIVVIKWNENDR